MSATRPSRGRRPSAPRLFAALAATAMAVALVACGPSDGPPVRSPADDRAVTPAPGTPSAPVALPTPPPTPTATPTSTPPPAPTPAPPVSTATPAPASDREAVIGAAIEVMAEWTGAAATVFALESAEPVNWPNSCLGIARPDIACAEVITPGWRVVLRDPFGGLHEVRTDERSRLGWAPQSAARGVVVALDASVGRLSIEREGERVELRAVPGTIGSLADLREGAEALVAWDVDPAGTDAGVLAWADRP